MAGKKKTTRQKFETSKRLSDAERKLVLEKGAKLRPDWADKILRKAGGVQVSTAELKRFVDELSGPTITKSGKPKGRNPHVGLKIEKTTNKQRVEQRRKARKKKRGTVRAVHRRK